MPRNDAEPFPIRPRMNVLASAYLAPQSTMDHRERQTMPTMGDEDRYRQHRMVMTAVAPAEGIDAV